MSLVSDGLTLTLARSWLLVWDTVSFSSITSVSLLCIWEEVVCSDSTWPCKVVTFDLSVSRSSCNLSKSVCRCCKKNYHFVTLKITMRPIQVKKLLHLDHEEFLAFQENKFYQFTLHLVDLKMKESLLTSIKNELILASFGATKC